jgi:hypothetical protein
VHDKECIAIVADTLVGKKHPVRVEGRSTKSYLLAVCFAMLQVFPFWSLAVYRPTSVDRPIPGSELRFDTDMQQYYRFRVANSPTSECSADTRITSIISAWYLRAECDHSIATSPPHITTIAALDMYQWTRLILPPFSKRWLNLRVPWSWVGGGRRAVVVRFL